MDATEQTYKLLLVDDEEEVRRAIARKLDWAALGFELAGEATNGEEALELAESLQPDVVMTDIKMPFMDGLTLCRHLKRVLPGVRIAVFSGFDEFEYAKEAIRLEVEEYILKPIDADELSRVFSRIRASLDREIAERRDVERLRVYYEESLPLMRNQVLVALLEGGLEPERAAQLMRDYGVELAPGRCCVAVVRRERADGGEDDRLMGYSLRQLVEDMVGGAFPFALVPMPDDIALLFTLDERQTERTVAAHLGRLFPAAKKLLGVRVSIGVGSLQSGLRDVHISYEEAKSALEYRVLVEHGKCVCIGDVEPGAGSGAWDDTPFIEDVLRQIKVGGAEELAAAVSALSAHLRETPLTLQRYHIFNLEMAGGLLRLVRAYRLDGEQGGMTAMVLEASSKAQAMNLDEMPRALLEVCETLRQRIRRERKDSARGLVETATAYLAGHFADPDLSADLLAGVLNVSPAYFSTLFKKETGLGFVAYLTKLRLEKALEYLNTTDDKTYLISERVGYLDPNYFSYVFKKQYGMSPSKYRASQSGAGA